MLWQARRVHARAVDRTAVNESTAGALNRCGNGRSDEPAISMDGGLCNRAVHHRRRLGAGPRCQFYRQRRRHRRLWHRCRLPAVAYRKPRRLRAAAGYSTGPDDVGDLAGTVFGAGASLHAEHLGVALDYDRFDDPTSYRVSTLGVRGWFDVGDLRMLAARAAARHGRRAHAGAAAARGATERGFLRARSRPGVELHTRRLRRVSHGPRLRIRR